MQSLSALAEDMNMADFSYKPERSGNYFLNIQLGTAGCVIAIIDENTHRCLAFQTITFPGSSNWEMLDQKFSELCQHLPSLQSKYKRVFINLEHPRSTLIPGEIYFDELKKEYLDLIFEEDPSEEHLSEYIPMASAFNVFSIGKNLKESLKNLFPSARISHFSTPLITGVLQNNEGQEYRAFLNIEKNSNQIIIADGTRLKFYNTFQGKSSKDILYFILNVMEEQHLSPSFTEVVLMGDPDTVPVVSELLKKYITRVKNGPEKVPVSFSPGVNLPEYSFYPLFNLHKCA